MSTATTRRPARSLEPGTVLVSPHGQVKVIRSRTGADDGWNCSDGAAVPDVDADDEREWRAYRPDELADALRLAREVEAVLGHAASAGGLSSWDACSGRPCVLPKLAKLIG